MPGSVVTPSERLDLERLQQLMLLDVTTEEDEEEYCEFLFLSWALIEEQRQSEAHPDRFLDWRRLIDEHTAARIVDCRMLTRFDPAELRRIAKAVWGDEMYIIHEDPAFGRLVVPAVHGLIVLCARFASQGTAALLCGPVGLSRRAFGRVYNMTCLSLCELKEHLLTDTAMWDPYLDDFARAINRRSAFFTHVIAFIDGTVQAMCRPGFGIEEESMYNAYYKGDCSCHGCCCSPPVSHSPVLPVSHHRTRSEVLLVDRPLWAASRRVGPRHDPGERRSDV